MQKITISLFFLFLFGKICFSQTEITTFHRSGQTFITWAENPMAGQYRIYRHDQPISVANLTQATRIAVLGQGSGRHITEEWRNNGFNNQVQERFVIQDLGASLPIGTGLCVWTTQPDDATTAYYCVTRVQNGLEILEIQAGINSSANPTSEVVHEPEPVRVWQSTDGLSAVYTQFIDIKNWNITYEGFAYNYAVMKPAGYNPANSYPIAFDLHCWGCRYNPTLAGGSPFGLPVILVYPDDPGKTWWFGFSKTQQYRTQWPDANWGLPPVNDAATSGPIINFTEQRVLQILDDLEQVGGYNFDKNRVYFWGNSMGGTGVIQFSMRYPDIVAAGYGSIGVTNFEVSHWNYEGAALWGPTFLDLPIEIGGKNATHLQKFNGQSVWDWQNAQKQMRDRQADEMAFLCTAHGDEDIYVEWWNQGAPWYELMQDSMRRGGSGWTQNMGGHDWMGFRGTNLNWGWLTNAGEQWLFPKNSSFPAFSHFSGNSWTNHNLNIQYAAPWNFGFPGNIVDLPNEWSILLKLADHPQFASTFNIPLDSAWTDVTPRRLQNFKIEFGKSYRWQLLDVLSNVSISEGTLVPDQFGLLTVPQILLKNTARRLKIVPYDAPPIVCDAPASSSVTNILDNSAQISWPTNPDALGFLVNLGQLDSTNLITIFTPNSTILLENLANCSDYFINIQTICLNGLTSSASVTDSFSTSCPPPIDCLPPSSLSIDNIMETSADFTWSNANAATSYIFQYKNLTNGDSTITNLVATNWSLQNLPACSNFLVSIQSVCNNNVLSAESFSVPFSTACPPPICAPPTDLATINTTDTTANIVWTNVSGSVGYHFIYKNIDSTNFITLNLTNANLLLENLPNCDTFTYQVQTVCANNLTSDFTPNLTFSTICPPICEKVTDLTLIDTSFNSANIAWQNTISAINYLVYYRIVGTNNWLIDTTTNIYFTIENLNNCAFYETKIQSICAQIMGDFSDILTFKTACIVATDNVYFSKNGLKIYPNPASETVFFDFDKTLFGEKFDLEILDATGRKVLIMNDLSENKCAFDTLPTGIFQVVLRFKNGRKLIGRVVVIR
jgi:pimeloyl-ACP methyl ester carboxylesterase